MKPVLIALCVFVIPVLSAQSFEWTGEWGTRTEGFLHTSNGDYFLAGSGNASKNGITILDSLGNIKNAGEGYYSSDGYQIHETTDGGYMVNFVSRAPDCYLPVGFARKYDLDWNILWEIEIPLGFHSLYSAPMANGKTIFANTAGFRIYNENGILLNSTILQNSGSSLLASNGNEIIWARVGGEFKRINTDGSETGLSVEHRPLLMKAYGNDEVFTVNQLHPWRMYHWNSELELLGEYSFEGDVLDFDFFENKMAVLLENDNGGFEIQFSSIPFSVYGSLPFEYPDLIPQKIIYKGDSVLIAGKEIYSSGNGSISAAFIKSILLNGLTMESEVDAGATLTSAGNTEIIYQSGDDLLEMNNLKFTIENYGQNTLTYFQMVAVIPYNGNIECPSYYFIQEEFTDVNLPPGEMIDVETAPIQFLFERDDPPEEICFYIYLPNRKIDDYHQNNQACLDLVVHSGQVALGGAIVSVSPNPTSDFLDIFTSKPFSENMEIHILNNYGQVVKKGIFEKYEVKKKVRINELSAGIYFLKIIEKGGSVYAEKIIITQ